MKKRALCRRNHLPSLPSPLGTGCYLVADLATVRELPVLHTNLTSTWEQDLLSVAFNFCVLVLGRLLASSCLFQPFLKVLWVSFHFHTEFFRPGGLSPE